MGDSLTKGNETIAQGRLEVGLQGFVLAEGFVTRSSSAEGKGYDIDRVGMNRAIKGGLPTAHTVPR